MLALPGALLGIGLAWCAGPWILHSLGNHQGAEISLSLRPDLTVLAVTAICALLCTILFGMAPAWTASRVSVEAALRGTQSRMAPGTAGVRRFFVPLQVALSLALVVVAALLGSTVIRLRTDNSGYRTKNVLFYITDFNRVPQKGADLVALYRRLTAAWKNLPGVIDASVTEIPPLLGWQDKGKFVAANQAGHAAPTVSDSERHRRPFLLRSGHAPARRTRSQERRRGHELMHPESGCGQAVLSAHQRAGTDAAPASTFIGDTREKPHDCEVVGYRAGCEIRDIARGVSADRLSAAFQGHTSY